MSDILRIERYFAHAATSFDGLYSEAQTGQFVRYLNRKLRSDVYERFLLTLNHVRAFHFDSTLDVGCGSGRYEEALVPLGVRRMVGVDVSPSMIAMAKERIRPLEQSGAIFDFSCCEFLALPTTETFDLIIAMGLFDYVNDPVRFLQKMRTLCNHSVIASFPSVSISRMPLRKVRYYFKRCPVYFYTQAMISSFASRAGFSKIEVKKMAGAGMDYFATFFK